MTARRKMPDEAFLSVLSAELQSSVAWAMEHIHDEQTKNLQYYLGAPMGNESKGRSQLVSWDVFEAIESAMPGFIEPFFAGDNIAVYSPRTPDDEAYAEQATDYANYIVKQRNEGFQLFATWIKDALLSKVGVVRAEWESEEPTRQQFRGLMPEQLAMLGQDGAVQVIEHHAYPMPGAPVMPGGQAPMLHDVTVLRRAPGCVKIENVRPENFVVTAGVGSIAKARLIGEWVVYTRSDLREMGIKHAATVDSYDLAAVDGTLATARDGLAADIRSLHDDSTDPALEEVRLFKGFLRADRDGDGIAEWRRVLIGGGENPILEDEEASTHNYAVISPIMIPHRIIGQSYADVARPIQELKTALYRQYLDSLYLANRPRTFVNLDAGVSLDDLLSDRIGGIVRGRGPAQNALQPLQTTAVARDALEGIQLADGMRETRLGIPKFNPGLEADALHKTATGVRSINNLVDKRQKMTLRVMAETGIKDLFRLVLRLITEYQDAPAMVRLRGQFVPFDPRGWSPDMDVTVEVGVGTSDETETMMMLQQFGQYMTWAATAGVVQPQNVYEFGKMLAKNARLKGADVRLLTDPQTVPPKPPPPDPKLAIEQFKAQTDAQRFQAEAAIEQQRMQADMQRQMAQDQNRQEMEARQKQLELQQQAQLEAMKQDSQERQTQAKLDHERWRVEFEAAQALQLEAMRQQATAMPAVDLSPVVAQLEALAEYVMSPAKMLRDPATGAVVGVQKGAHRFAVERDERGQAAGLQRQQLN